MYSLFFPVAITVVIMIVLVVGRLVAQEKSSTRRQKMWAAGYFATQDARYARAEEALREGELTRTS